MILGVEGIHTWESGIVLNDRSTLPHYKVRRVSGAHATGELDHQADPAIGRIGEVPRESDRGGKTLTYEGDVVADSLEGLREATAALVAAFSTSDVLRMDVTPHPLYPGDLPDRYFHARPISCEVEDDQAAVSPFRTSRGYERPFSLVLRLDDPRVYDPVTVDIESDAFTLEPGDISPITPPAFLKPANQNSVSLLINNEGNAPVDAVFRMYGPAANPVISIPGTGLHLRFKKLNIGENGHVIVNFRRRRIVRGSNNANLRHKLDPTSTWWNRGEVCLAPGETTVRYRAYAIGEGAKLRVTYNHGDWA